MIDFRKNTGLTFYATNSPEFKTWLKTNPVIDCLLKATSMAEFLKHFQPTDQSKDKEQLNSLYTRMIESEPHLFNDYIKLHHLGKTLNETSQKIIDELFYELFSTDLPENYLYTEACRIFNENAATHGLSPAFQKDIVISYQYHQHNCSITEVEFTTLYQNFEKVIASLANKKLPRLVFTGAHGSSNLLNNLSIEQLTTILELLIKNNIRFDIIVLECCKSASHIRSFIPLLGASGIILASKAESTSKFYSDLLSSKNVSSEHIVKTLQYNETISLYLGDKKQIYSPMYDGQSSHGYDGKKLSQEKFSKVIATKLRSKR